MDNFDPTAISVNTSCYNAAAYVEEAIASVLQQSHRHIGLIIVDDGSSDESVPIIAHLAVDNPGRINVLHQTNSGPHAARNRGLARACGNFVTSMDADDYWHANARMQPHATLTDSLGDIAYCGWQNVGEAAANTQPHIPPNYAGADTAATRGL